MKRGTLPKIILEKLSEVSELALDGLFPKNRSESGLWREILGLPTDYKFSKQTFSNTLNRLKQQGLVKNTGGGRYSFWLLTYKGQNKLKSYNHNIVPAKTDGIPRLVMYDIPEKYRRKRDWLRSELATCAYRQLQRSVWLGYSPLPQAFIESLQDTGLRNSVHIVSIHKTGTITEF